MTKLIPVPWDTRAFNIECYEVLGLDGLDELKKTTGYFTLKLNPLTSAAQIQEFGFRYVDTLIVPVCDQKAFVGYPHPEVSITKNVKFPEVLAIASNAFIYGRYHRDGSIPLELAERRYQNWLTDLYSAGKVVGIEYQEKLAAFIGIEGSKLVLHAVHSGFRGLGLAKFLWTPVCEELFSKGYSEIESSISAANLAVVNLYARLGFTMESAQDVYHFHNIAGSK